MGGGNPEDIIACRGQKRPEKFHAFKCTAHEIPQGKLQMSIIDRNWIKKQNCILSFYVI